MPRKGSKKKKSKDQFFSLLAAVVALAFLSGLDFYFQSGRISEISSPDVSANMLADTVSGVSWESISDKGVIPISPTGDFEEETLIPVFDPGNPNPQCVFYPSRRNILHGQSVKLMWDCINASRCEIDGIGQVPPSNIEGIEVAPQRSGMFSLDCYGSEKRSFGANIWVFEFAIKEIMSTSESLQ
ncbi:MAG: hypothetical protein PHS16_02315 [Candidatus Colwellbacteria bacterium]|jgi:hypothetical protein|nr:hypothetical protein [Candidatus Colwellbacteria bacterium]MDD4818938.1 hypothetical protein [Candidatus Colwellbacteria bacterium]